MTSSNTTITTTSSCHQLEYIEPYDHMKHGQPYFSYHTTEKGSCITTPNTMGVVTHEVNSRRIITHNVLSHCNKNEHVVRMMPRTCEPSEKFRKAYKADFRSHPDKDLCGYWGSTSESNTYDIYGFSSEYMNYIPHDETLMYGLRLNNEGPIVRVVYWANPDTLVCQSLEAFSTLREMIVDDELLVLDSSKYTPIE